MSAEQHYFITKNFHQGKGNENEQYLRKIKSNIKKIINHSFFIIKILLLIIITLLLLPVLIVIEISIIIINKFKKSTKIDVSSESENEKTSKIKTFDVTRESVDRSEKRVRFKITTKEGITTEEEGVESNKITIHFTINDDKACDLNGKRLTIKNFIDQSELEDKFNIVNNENVNLKNPYLFGIYLDDEFFSYVYVQGKNFSKFFINRNNQKEYNPVIDQINDIAIYKIIEHEKNQ